MVATMRNTAGFWNELKPPLLYIISHILTDRRSGRWLVVLTTYVIEVKVNWWSEAWDFWKLWLLPSAVLASFYRLFLRPCLGKEGLADLYYFLLVLDDVERTNVLYQ